MSSVVLVTVERGGGGRPHQIVFLPRSPESVYMLDSLTELSYECVCVCVCLVCYITSCHGRLSEHTRDLIAKSLVSSLRLSAYWMLHM